MGGKALITALALITLLVLAAPAIKRGVESYRRIKNKARRFIDDE